MLDKSLPYAGFYMYRKPGTPAAQCRLPDGFKFSLYEDGADASWARIETSVLEFDSEFAALLFFKENYAPYPEELGRRCLFIETETGEKIATATAWWSDVEGMRAPWLQWVGADPRYQGMGIGKALISKAVELMVTLEGEAGFYLHTQTWSYKAVSIYKANGFQPTDKKTLYKERKDNYKKAMRILGKISAH